MHHSIISVISYHSLCGLLTALKVLVHGPWLLAAHEQNGQLIEKANSNRLTR